jgi:CDP-diacylglycerol pyrophosphatase
VRRTFSILSVGLLLGTSFVAGAAQPRLPAQDDKPENGPSAQTTPKPSVLLRLAVQCSKDIAAVSDCRSFTTNDKQEYIILKDNAPQKPEGFLLIPVQPVTGVDDEQIFSAPFADLWSSAWLWSEKYPGKPAAITGLAVNSALARTQNQLHIHVSCVRMDVATTLRKKKISSDVSHPTLVKLAPNQATYSVVAVSSLDGANSPFLIAQAIAKSTKTEMRQQGIAVIQGKKNHGFYILDTAEARGGAEELLDQTCAGK